MTGQSPQEGNPAQPVHQGILAECDLVMKGGITSGIVYPPAVNELIDIYRLRNIGGTSVGAMAAAVIAAAEFYRQTRKSTAGFVCLDTDVKKWLKTDDNLLKLFPPTQQTRPLLEFALKLLPIIKSFSSHSQTAKASFGKTLMDLMRRNCPITGAIIGFLLFAILTLAILALLSLSVYSLLPFLALIVVAAIGARLGWQAGNVIGAIISLPRNFYGICTGYTPEPQDRQEATPTVAPQQTSTSSSATDQPLPASQNALTYDPGTRTDLTDWLDYTVNCVSGKEQNKPLTMKDLRQYQIELKMVTTNLSQTLPYIIPEGLCNFLFNEREMKKFVP